MKKVFNYLIGFIKNVQKDEVSIYAAQSSFFIIISAIPFIMLALALTRMFIPLKSYTMIALIEPYIPYSFMGMVEYVINEVYEKSSSFPLLSISAVTLIWSASKGLASLGIGICRIYKQPVSGYIRLRLKSMMYTFLFILIFIAVLVFMVLGAIFSAIQDIVEGPVATVFILMMFFSGLYYVSSKQRISYIKNLVGSMIAALGWFLFSYIFGIYIEHFVDYSYIYGSLGIMVIFMLWLYFCMNIVLIGAEINMYLFDEKKIK